MLKIDIWKESDMKIDLSFFANSIILFAIIIALTVFKVVSCKPFREDGEDFSWKKLIIGLAGNLIVLAILSFVYFVGSQFGQDLAVVKIGDATYTVQAALNALIILAIGVYGVKLYKNAVEFFGLNKDAKTASVSKELEVYDYNVPDDLPEKG